MTMTWDGSDALMKKGRGTFLNNMTLAAQSNGVISGLAVTEKGAGANMSVDVAAGAWIAGTGATYFTTSTTNIAVTAAHATLNRYDIVVADVANTVSITDGTAAAVPQVPALPANKILLAIITVAATDTSIEDADITDCRISKRATVIEHVGYSQTQASVGLTAGAGFSDILTVAITNAQATYSKLIATADGYTSQPTTSQADMVITKDNVAVGSTTQIINGNTGTDQNAYALTRVLLAGTDYTRGTGFTLKLRASATTADLTCKGNALIVKGVI